MGWSLLVPLLLGLSALYAGFVWLVLRSVRVASREPAQAPLRPAPDFAPDPERRQALGDMSTGPIRRYSGSGYGSVVLDRLLRQACRLMGVEQGIVFALDPRDATQVIAVAAHGVDDEVIGQRFPAGGGVLGDVLAGAEPVWTVSEYRDLSPRVRLAGPDTQAPGLSRVRRGATAPLRWGGEVNGALAMGTTGTGRWFGRREIRMFSDLCDLVAAALSDARMHDRLEPAMEAGVEALAASTQVLSRGAALRAEAVAELARQVGERLGLEPAALVEVELAGRLQDLGPSDGADVLMGARSLSSVPGLEVVATIVEHRAERWDGTGAPDGLGGERIPLGSRIVSACDAFLAEAGYRGGAGSAGLERLEHGVGSEFDPAVVSALRDVVENAA